MSLQAPSLPDLRREVHDAARRARVASRVLALLPTVAKDQALQSAAEAIAAHAELILAANAEDLKAARAAGTPTAMLDRLALDSKRVDGIAAGLRQVAGLPDPVGEVLRGYTLPNGLHLRQQRVPLRRHRHDLRGPAQRHRRRFRFGAQVRQRRAVARKFVGGEVQPGARRGVARFAGQRGLARRRGPAAFGR